MWLDESSFVADVSRRFLFCPFPFILTGAHFEDEGDAFTVMEEVVKGVGALQERYPNIRVAWKTINPGHVDCTAFSAPVDHARVIAPGNQFHWDLHKQFDKIAYSYANKTGMPVIDMSPLDKRPDAHPANATLLLHKAVDHDCLHYCTPGPVDVFSTLLLNMLFQGEL